MKSNLKNILICIIVLSAFKFVDAQNIDSLRVLSFEKAHQNLNYQKLVQKYNKAWLEVDTVELEYLYYLKYKNEDFTYYDLTADEKLFRAKYNSGDYRQSASAGIKLLQKDPTDLKTLLYTAISLKKINQGDSAAAFQHRFDVLLKIISRYGDGKTMETAYQLVKISDEYAILEHSKEMFYNRKTKQQSDCIIDTWDIFNVKTKTSYTLNFKFNNLYTYPKK